jgi:translation initiation factor IF-3
MPYDKKNSQNRKNQKLFFKWEETKFSPKIQMGKLTMTFNSDQVIKFKLDFLKEKLML